MIKPASRTTLYQDVVKQMVDMIKDDVWEPGGKIPSEKDLANMFCVGRNSIREATKSLAVFGIVDSRPGQGTFVCEDALRKISNTELLKYLSDDSTWIELMEVRLILEVQLAYWAAEKATPEDIEKLRKIMSVAKNRVTRKYPRDAEHFRIYANFHEAIAEIAGNRLALKFLRSIRCEMEVQRQKYLEMEEQQWHKEVEFHEIIIEHIANKTPELAREAMHNHLMAGLKMVSSKKKIDS